MNTAEAHFTKQNSTSTVALPAAAEPHTLVVEDESLRRGFTTIPNYILDDCVLSVGAKYTYILLLSFAWQEGSCFPGQKRLAEKLGLKERMVRYYLHELEAHAWIAVKQRGLGKTNLYIIKKQGVEADRQPAAAPNRQCISIPKRHFTADKTDTEQKDAAEQKTIPSKFRKDNLPLKNEAYRPEERCSTAEGTSLSEAPSDPRKGHSMSKIAMVFADLSRGKLHDPAHEASNITRALNLWRASEFSESEFLVLVREACRITLQRTGSIRKRAEDYMGLRNHAPYFFQVLQDLCRRRRVRQFRTQFSSSQFSLSKP